MQKKEGKSSSATRTVPPKTLTIREQHLLKRAIRHCCQANAVDLATRLINTRAVDADDFEVLDSFLVWDAIGSHYPSVHLTQPVVDLYGWLRERWVVNALKVR